MPSVNFYNFPDLSTLVVKNFPVRVQSDTKHLDSAGSATRRNLGGRDKLPVDVDDGGVVGLMSR